MSACHNANDNSKATTVFAVQGSIAGIQLFVLNRSDKFHAAESSHSKQ